MHSILLLFIPVLWLVFELFEPESILAVTPLSLCLLLVTAVVFKSVYYVKPSERRLLVNTITGAPRVLESGIHWVPSPFLIEQRVRGWNWRMFNRFPEVGSRLHIDPRATQVHTSDDIAATADVSLECLVREWGPTAVLKDSGCIHTRACTIVNQWLSEQLSEIPAHQCTYGHLNQFLNHPERVDTLNAMLASGFTYLSAQRIVIDANGIQLSPNWVSQREDINQKRQLLAEREKVLEKELVLARIERIKMQEANEWEEAAERRKVEHKIANSKLELEAEINAVAARGLNELKSMKAKQEHEDAREVQRMSHMIANGLSPEQYCRVALARVHFETMAQSTSTKYIAVPPNLLGLSPMNLVTNAINDDDQWTNE